MQWLELTIKTTSSGIDLLAERLTVLGYDSFIIDDQEDFQDFLDNNHQYWDYVDEALSDKMRGLSQIRLYIEDHPDAMEQISSLKDELRLFKAQCTGVDLGSLEVSLDNIQNEDWENNWKQYYQPLPIGERLMVVPQWLTPEIDDGRLPVLLDPGMIFGTGAHASTQMCMIALEQNIHGGESIIDLGSGSGILSITALLLGAKSAVGVDIDPKAEDIARDNASINHLGADRFTAITADVLSDQSAMERLRGEYDIVLANIVADVIIPLSQVVPSFMAPDGCFICSGILEQRLPEVICALEQAGLVVCQTQMIDDWCRITAKLKKEGA